jgi:AraC family transcriptional regulator of adaptative response / DNA-3-methyladenine glycosylase II
MDVHGETGESDSRYRAVASRDRRFEGRFVVAVTSTRVYCRPGCPAPIPRERNVRFYPCAAAAEEAGFRACMRCRPDASPGTPAWLGTSATVQRALKLIFDGQLDDKVSVEKLAGRLGVGARHLRRLFASQVGASPGAIARTRRAHFARKLIDETDLTMTEVAACAGYASLRRFNDEIRDTFRRAPRELRRGRARPDARSALRLKLPYKPPYDWVQVRGFLAARAIPGVESVEEGAYRRTVRIGRAAGVLEVRPLDGEAALELTLHLPPERELLKVVERVGQLFDLRADPLAIGARLSQDRRLARRVAARPGLRVPGAWDPFELMVRAILGQQVSVAGASTLAGRLVARFGTPLATDRAGLTHLFPSAEKLAVADVAAIGMPRARGEAIRAIARAFAGGRASSEDELRALPGVGPWTAAYVAMRAFGEPDAFPAADLGLRHALARGGELPSAREVEARAEAWRPFRAYAAMHLWTSLTEESR